MKEKICQKCRLTKPLSAFGLRGGQVQKVCKSCKTAEHALINARRKRVCTCCNKSLALSCFYSRAGVDGLMSICKDCHNGKKRKTTIEDVQPVRVSSNPWENLGLEWRGHVPKDLYSARCV